MRAASHRPTPAQQLLLDGLQVRLLAPADLPRGAELLQQHHYLGALHPVGECLHYALTDAAGDWLGVLVFCAAARRLRRALGIRLDRTTGNYPAPSQPTFCRLYAQVDAQVDARVVERALLAFQTQLRGAPPPKELIVFDDKEPRHTGGQQVLTAITVPIQHYLV